MLKKPKKFLIISFFSLILVCILTFSWLSFNISQKSESSINNIGQIYMSEMNNQLRQKFTSIINLRLSQVQGIVERTSPDTYTYGDVLLEEMILNARIRNFAYLGLYMPDGKCKDIYGSPIEISHKDSFLNTLNQGDSKFAMGYNRDGETLLILGADAAYSMGDGTTSTALVAGILMEDLKDALALNENSGLIYTHIICQDGNFVIQSTDEPLNNYFDYMEKFYQDFNHKTVSQYVKELQEAIATDKDYATIVKMADGEVQHIYCSSLSNSDWYLVSIMPFGMLDAEISNLGNQRIYTIASAFLLIFVVIISIFIIYYRMSQQQLMYLDKAKEEADRANKAKSEFLSSMSHDIRTPMNGIVGMTAIAMSNMDNPERVKDCLNKITLSSRHLLGLINDVLDMSKIESGKLSLNIIQISLREIMDSIVNIIQPQVKEKNLHFDIFIRDIHAEDVYCDNVRLNQILINLLSNALKFTPEGGRVDLYLNQELSPVGDNYVRCHFCVKDNGIGMTPEFQKEIFNTFTREKNLKVNQIEGSGLGMAITKAIVDAMNGSIELKSTPGEGSEFHITLDLEKAMVQEKDMLLPSWNILVVDDNEELCQSALSSLKEIGIDADSALDGRIAMQMVKERQEKQEGYQIILLDWKMPDMDGVETSRQLRKILGKDVPILIISSYNWNEIEDEAREAGASGFIAKPLFKSSLYLGLSPFILGESAQKEKPTEYKNEFLGKQILLAEDNELNWEIAEEILSESGFELERAENGQICVEKFKQSEIGFYDAILMDIRMPIMNGYDAAKAIRALKREDADLPIIAMTADAFSDDIQHCLDSGMNEHVAKPIQIDRLKQILKKYLK